MSKERELLERVLTSELWSVQEELQVEIKELLAEPEKPEPPITSRDSAMIKKEAVGAKPFYRPGDIVTNIYGDKGVIVKAEVIVEGRNYDWKDKVPTYVGNGWRPKYAIEWFVNSKGGADYKENKYAWWEAHEWADVELGLVHSKQGKHNENYDA